MFRNKQEEIDFAYQEGVELLQELEYELEQKKQTELKEAHTAAIATVANEEKAQIGALYNFIKNLRLCVLEEKKRTADWLLGEFFKAEQRPEMQKATSEALTNLSKSTTDQIQAANQMDDPISAKKSSDLALATFKALMKTFDIATRVKEKQEQVIVHKLSVFSLNEETPATVTMHTEEAVTSPNQQNSHRSPSPARGAEGSS